MKLLFLAMTPAQFLNCMVLKMTIYKDEKGDLLYTENLAIYANNIRKLKLFDNVLMYRLIEDIMERSNAIKRSIVRVKNALDIKKVQSSLPVILDSYDSLFLSGISLRNYEIYYAAKRRNKRAKIILYEEGLCEYCHLSKKSISQELFSHIFFHHYYPRECDELFVYEPEVARCAWSNIQIKRIPKFFSSKFLLDTVTQVFEYKNSDFTDLEGKILFVEGCFSQTDLEEKQRRYLYQLIDIFGHDRVVVKMHPRSPRNKYRNDIKKIFSSIPFEVVIANIDVARIVFLSIMSSVVTNMKLMLNKEPIVICLYRLVNISNLNEVEEVFVRISEMYDNGKFLIPNNENEYMKILNEINLGENL